MLSIPPTIFSGKGADVSGFPIMIGGVLLFSAIVAMCIATYLHGFCWIVTELEPAYCKEELVTKGK